MVASIGIVDTSNKTEDNGVEEWKVSVCSADDILPIETDNSQVSYMFLMIPAHAQIVTLDGMYIPKVGLYWKKYGCMFPYEYEVDMEAVKQGFYLSKPPTPFAMRRYSTISSQDGWNSTRSDSTISSGLRRRLEARRWCSR